MGLSVRLPITGPPVAMGSSLGLGNSSSLPVEEACASSGMGFRAPESPKGSFVGVGSELARPSPRSGHSSSLSVKEACASSGMGFRAPESLKGSFAGVGSELARSSLGLRHSFVLSRVRAKNHHSVISL